jgi:hypothetical protein
MTSTDSGEISNEGLTKERAKATAELYIHPPSKRINPDSKPASVGQRLDVDAVLERSVRKVVTE